MATHTRVNQDSKEKWAMDVNVANPIEVEVSDIQIGAVEIKDGTTDTRASVITQDAAFGTASKGLPLFGKYQASPTTYTDGDAVPILLDANGRIVLESDIQLGAVELKDADSTTRAKIKSDGTDNAVVVIQNSQPLPAGAATETTLDAINTKLVSGTDIGDVTINNASGASAVNIQDGGNSVTVDSTDLDIRDLSSVSDSIEVVQDTAADLNCTEANSGAIKTAVELIDNAIDGTEMRVNVISVPTTTITATDLDIRNLDSASDGIAIYGSDDGGTTKRIIKTDSGGAIQIDLEVAEVTANAGTDLNTSLLALESGGNLAAIASVDFATETSLASIDGKITTCDTGAVVVSSGAITETNSGDIKTSVGSIDTKITTCNTGAVTVSSIPDVSITDISKGTQTNDVKITLDSEVVAISSTDLDIRDLTSASDSVAAVCTNTGTFAVQATCTATSLDIRALADTTDNIEVTQGTAADLKCTATIDDSTPPKVDCNSSNVTIDNTNIAIEGGNASAVKVDGSAVTQPVSGSVTISGTATTTPTAATAITLAADGQVKATAGTVYAIHLSFVGVTAGDKVEIKNSADDSGTALITLVAPVAAGNIDFCPCVGSAFSTGIYMDETKTGGTFTATIVYA